ncbi:MAG: glycosyltransferase family 4 protein [Actinomycetota bacterium]|nr:glycosyltransferase family 4 protein [Actinomycetota bacterium]
MSGSAIPLLASVVPSAGTPLERTLRGLDQPIESHALGTDGTFDVPGSVTHPWELVDLPERSVRFSLSDDDLVALATPSFLRRVAELAGHREVLFIDRNCLVGSLPLLDPLPDGVHLELFPALAAPLASTKGSLRAALAAGAGRPTGAVLRLRGGGPLGSILDEWDTWQRAHYVARPTAALTASAAEYLQALPARSASVRWNNRPVAASWSDLRRDVDRPPIVDTTGLVRYQDTPDAALDLIERRTHDADIVRQLMAEVADGQTAHCRLRYRSGAGVTTLARSSLRATDPLGRRWEDPFDDGPDGFSAWLGEEDSRGLWRFAQGLYWARTDLQASFPATTTTVRSFQHWLAREGVGTTSAVGEPDRGGVRQRVGRRLRHAVGRADPTLAGPRQPPQRAHGVNVVGYARSESGLGEAMRATAGALQVLQVPTSVVDVGERIYSRRGTFLTELDEVGCPYDVTVFHLNPLELLGYQPDELAYRFVASRHVGFWAWETDQLPATWRPGLAAVDEVWAPSGFVRDAIRPHTDKPILVMGLPVAPPEGLDPDRARLGLPDAAFLVTYVTDAFSGLERKDPAAAVRAFDRAFDGSEDAHLLLKVSNLEKFPTADAQLRDLVRDRPITLIGGYLTRREVWELLGCSDAYLSLHAAEGFGLTILEAMALGVPVVVTGFGGNRDFTDATTALLVDYDLVPARGGPGGIYSGAGRWARPDVDQAAAHLQRLAGDAALRERLGEAGRRRAESYSPVAYADRVGRRLAELGINPRGR